TGRHLVILAVHRPQSLSLDSPQPAAPARVRLADCFFRDHCWFAFPPDADLALLAELHLQPGKPWPVGGGRRRDSERVFGGERDLPDGGYGGGHGTENLQQRPHPDKAGRAGTAAAAGTHGGVAESNQPALLVQYSELHFVARALRSRYGAGDDPETCYHSSPPAAQYGFVRPAARGSGVHRQLSGH